jgi:hypothetical protein
MPNFTDPMNLWKWETLQMVILVARSESSELIPICLSSGLKDLTGEAVEVMRLDDKSFTDQAPTLWNTLLHHITGALVQR